MKKGRYCMSKYVFAEEGVDENKVEHVCEELSHPCPEGQVDVESVLLFPSFDGLCKIISRKHFVSFFYSRSANVGIPIVILIDNLCNILTHKSVVSFQSKSSCQLLVCLHTS